ncbi:tail length tape measure protein, partial [Rhizobium subbaraonis]
MAAPYRISIGVNLDPAGAKAGAAATKNELDKIGAAAEATESKLQRLINASVGLHTGPANNNARAWTGILASEGMALDNLRAKYNPTYAAIRNYKQAITEIRTAYAQAAISADEMTAAMSRQRQMALSTIAAVKGRDGLPGMFVGSSRNDQFRRQNLSYQLFDIGQTAAMGMNPAMIFAQQGPQILQLYAGQGGVNAALKDLGTIAGGAARLITPLTV